MPKTAAGEALPFSPRPNRAREIRWRPWGREAFRIAQREDKPVLLDITTWWCEWCHRMDETSYSHQQVIDRANADYVAVRVDADRRPDVNERYTQGSWPTTALLAPGGEVLAAGSYIPPEELAPLLDQVTDWYRTQRADLRQAIADMEARRVRLTPYVCAPAEQPSAELLDRVAEDLRGRYDPIFGGFGDQPKFPHADAVRFALDRPRQPGGEGWLLIATRSLDAVAANLLDPVEGGFFRCADRRDWVGLHTEKLLEVNADLLQIYLEAYRSTGDPRYRRVAEQTIAYLESDLRNPDTPTFAGSQSADRNYYRLDRERRARTQPPMVDRTVLAEGNARAALAYLHGYRILHVADCLRTAAELLGFLWSEMADPVHGVVRYWDGRRGGPHLLRDQVWVASAMAEAHDVTGDGTFLERARTLAEVILRDYPGEPGGFYDVRAERDPVAGLRDRQWNLVENAQVARLMVRLARFGGNERYREAARSALLLFAEDYPRYGALEASYARALAEYLEGGPG